MFILKKMVFQKVVLLFYNELCCKPKYVLLLSDVV